MKQFAIVTADDWQGIYVNGKLVDETHRLRLSDILSILGVDYDDISVDQDWMESHGHLPKDFRDIPEEVITREK